MPTTEEDAVLRQLYQRLHDEPLRADVADDIALYEPIYKPTADHDEPVDLLAKHIEWNGVESIQFFSGFRGSGKTTELRRLQKKLQGKGYLVIYANALDYINPAGRIDITDLLINLAGAFSDALQDKAILGENILHETYWTRLVHFMNNTKIDITDIGIKAGDKIGAEVKLALKASPSFRQRIQAEMGTHIGALKKQVDQFFTEAIHQINKYHGQPQHLIFIFDSLEQIRGAVTSEKEVLNSVESLFANHLEKLSLPGIHVVYTVPPWLKFVLPGLGRIEILPSVRLWDDDGARTSYAPGIASLQSLLRRRLEAAGLARLFGNDDALTIRLIDACGGHLRDLLRLLREVMLRARGLPVNQDVVDRAIVSVASQYLPIAIDDAMWLDRISAVRRTDLQSNDDVHRLIKFLDSHMVLYFRNGKEWYDVHPLIRSEVAAIVADRKTSSPPDVDHADH